MPASRPVIYVDTNVIIEATRSGCWKAILKRYEVRTVEAVIREATYRPPGGSAYVAVEVKEVVICQVTAEERVLAAARAASLPTLDAGERDLLAHVASLPTGSKIISTADRAAIKTACALGLSGNLIALEEAAECCGLKPRLNTWFSKKWLTQIRTAFFLEAPEAE